MGLTLSTGSIAWAPGLRCGLRATPARQIGDRSHAAAEEDMNAPLAPPVAICRAFAPSSGSSSRARARRTEAARVYETGGWRLRFPRSAGACEAVVVNTGGGMAGGDRAQIEIEAGPGADGLVTSQSQEKIYRADGVGVAIETRLSVAAGARLVFAPQETLLFDGARLARRLEADVDETATLTIFEAVAFGRLAHGETRIDASLSDRWRIRRGGRLVFAEALRIEDAGATLDRPAVGGGARALATLRARRPRRRGSARRAARGVRRGRGGGGSAVRGRRQRRRRRAGRPPRKPLAAAVARGTVRRLARARRAGRAESLVLRLAILAALALVLAQGFADRPRRADLRRSLLRAVGALAAVRLSRSSPAGRLDDPRLDRAVRRLRVRRARAVLAGGRGDARHDRLDRLAAVRRADRRDGGAALGRGAAGRRARRSPRPTRRWCFSGRSRSSASSKCSAAVRRPGGSSGPRRARRRSPR